MPPAGMKTQRGRLRPATTRMTPAGTLGTLSRLSKKLCLITLELPQYGILATGDQDESGCSRDDPAVLEGAAVHVTRMIVGHCFCIRGMCI